MRPPFDAFLFDMDGVLVDSNPLHSRSWARFSAQYGVTTTPEMDRRMYGRRNDQIVREFFGSDLSNEEVAARGFAKEALYREMFGEQIKEALVPGLREFLERHAGLAMGVGTNAEPENVSFVLDRTGLRPYFQ